MPQPHNRRVTRSIRVPLQRLAHRRNLERQLQDAQRQVFGDTLRGADFDGQYFVRNSMLVTGPGCLRVVLPEDHGALIQDRGDGVGYWPMSIGRTQMPGYDLVSVLLGDGHGSFGPKMDFVAGQQVEGLAIADLNGDGLPDLAVTDAFDNTVSVLPGHGNGTFGRSWTLGPGRVPTPSGSRIWTATAGPTSH